MKKRIGLIDPALRRVGHHTYFMSYLYLLLKQAGMDVVVVDFDNVIKNDSDIALQDIVNVADDLPTDLFTRKQRSAVRNFMLECKKAVFFRNLKNRLDPTIDVWVIATYDPFTLPFLYYCGFNKKQIVPIVHYSKFFRKQKNKIYGLTSYWTPHLLFKNLCKSRFVLYLDEEHNKNIVNEGFRGKSAYLPYNAVHEEKINSDNRNKLSPKFRICTVGLIREDKDINFVMEAIKKDPEVEYFVGGKIADHVSGSPFIQRMKNTASMAKNIIPRFEYLSLEAYNEEIEKSHFTVVPITDKYKKGVQLTGLMIDGLINKRPFIGPDIYPMKKYAAEYGLGILYEYGNPDALKQALSTARQQGTTAYYDNICQFLRENSIERTAQRLSLLF